MQGMLAVASRPWLIVVGSLDIKIIAKTWINHLYCNLVAELRHMIY